MNILFATMPFDGHFNPLTGIAMHLKEAGHDVRWYAAPSYAEKLQRLGIPHFPFRRAIEINQDNIADLFPERAKLHGMAFMRFDGVKIFASNTENFYLDVSEIDATFSFDVLFCDAGFYAMKLVKEKLGKRVCSVDVGPSLESSADTPPNFLGLKPAKSAAGRLVHRGMKAMMERMAMAEPKRVFNDMLVAQGLTPIDGTLFDVSYQSPDVSFQNGVPSFAYARREHNPKTKFVGALLPHKGAISRAFPEPEKLNQYKPVILISQGTVDNKDPEKLIVPALEALKDTGALLVVTTGHGDTTGLRQRYPQDNIVIEDFVDFNFIFNHTDLFITNGGYGSVLLSLSKGVPVLGAGVKEGKNDINAQVDYFGVGLDLRTENPKPAAIRRATARLLSEPQWKQNVARLRDEFKRYDPYPMIDAYLASIN